MKPEIMIVGTQHYHEIFSHSDPDEQFLDSVNIFRDSLIKFQPTRICIEQEEKSRTLLMTASIDIIQLFSIKMKLMIWDFILLNS